MGDNGHRTKQARARDLADAYGRFTPLWIKWLQRAAEPAGLSPARLRVLGALHQQGPQPMHTLAELLGVTPRNVTALIDGLEEDGLVERRRHPSDRRSTVVALTKQGMKVIEVLWDDHLDRTGEVFATLSAADQEALLRILGTLERTLGERLD